MTASGLVAISARTCPLSKRYFQALSDAASAYRTALFNGVAEHQSYGDLVASRATAVEALEQAKADAAQDWTNATSNANIADTGACVADESLLPSPMPGKKVSGSRHTT